MNIGIWQIAIIILVVVLLFGAGKIPRLMKDIGLGIKSFKQGMDEDPAKLEDDKKDKDKS